MDEHLKQAESMLNQIVEEVKELTESLDMAHKELAIANAIIEELVEENKKLKETLV